MPAAPDRTTDRPLTDPQQDDFQRAHFATRLAQILLAPSHTASIVVGLYGKWGEGKSTVLNFIKQHLVTIPDKVLVMSFNPWLFPDESQLLNNFFAQLAREIEGAEPEEEQPLVEGALEKAKQWIEQNIKKTDKPLHTRKETLAKLASDYAGGISYAGVGLSKVLNIVLPSPPNLDQLRKRIEEKIVASGKRVVIIIDDIDRLEKGQIQAVFRLVKLTADFRQTSYLLAFDDVMVARAIGEIFAAGADATSSDSFSAGQNFLEKIVQVPLRLPRARSQDLLNYAHARITEALADTTTELDPEADHRTGQRPNRQHFIIVFRRGVLPRLTTPRLAIRYANAIRFSLPLLHGEVNTIDLLLVEALNIFYPELHQFVAGRQDLFAGIGQKPRLHSAGEGNGAYKGLDLILTEFFEKNHYSAESISGARSILTVLFPVVATEFDEWAHWENSRAGTSEADLNRLQAVAAPNYFSRYFSYSIANGDVSDQEFNAFVQSGGPDQLTQFRSFAQRLGTSITLDRISYRLPDLSTDQCRNLFTCLAAAADQYQAPRNWDEVSFGELFQAANLLPQLLAKLPDLEERERLAHQLLSQGGNYELAYAFDQRLQVRYEAEHKSGPFGEPSQLESLFSPDSWTSWLATNGLELLHRALHEADSVPLYCSHPTYASKLLTLIWPQVDIPPGPVDYLLPLLQQNSSDIVEFLQVCGQRASSPGSPFYRIGISPKDFDRLRDIFGQPLYDLVRAQFGDEVVERVDFNKFDEPTPRQRLSQFIYLYEHRPSPVEPVADVPDPSN